jgi:acyl-coenzyme A synthetase/AMP-(fatty) acid ligase
VLFAAPGLRKGCFVAFGVEDAERGTELLVVVAEVEPDAACREVAAGIRQAVATELGVTITELALVPKGALTKTSSGKRRHRHFRELYLQGRLEVLYRAGTGRIG